MSLPLDSLSSMAASTTFLSPDSTPRSDLLEDWERGGVALSDPSQGLLVQDWRIFLDGNDVTVRAETTAVETVVFTETGITELSLAFDQNMRPTVAYVAGGQSKLYWYDTSLGSQVFTTLEVGVTSPRLCLDDKRPSQNAASDVLLFYIKGGSLCYRQQRDRYTIERNLATMPAGATRLLRVGMSTALRVQIEVGSDLGATSGATYSASYTDILTDTKYVVAGTDIVPFLDTGVRTGTWKSKKIVLREHPSFGWLRLNGPMAEPATIRIYADGTLWYTVAVTTREPVRLPPGRHKHWEIEIESTGQFTNIALASIAEELL